MSAEIQLKIRSRHGLISASIRRSYSSDVLENEEGVPPWLWRGR